MFVLIFYGDMDVLCIEEKFVGCKLIKMSVVLFECIDDVVVVVENLVCFGNVVYWVCLLVEELDVIVGIVVEICFEYLKLVFGWLVGLMYGCLMGEEKDVVIGVFCFGKI